MEIRVTDVRSGESHAIELPEPVYEVYGTGNAEWKSNCFSATTTNRS